MSQTPAPPRTSPGKSRRMRMVLVNSLALAGAVGVISLLGFARHAHSTVPVHRIEIRLSGGGGHEFLDSAEIRSAILREVPGLIGTPAREIDLQKIHSRLATHPVVARAEVYATVDGRFRVHIRQRDPIARILNSDGSGFYVDRSGYCMPLSRQYTAHVPVFTGHLQETRPELPIHALATDTLWSRRSHLDEIYSFAQFLQENDFMAAQTEHVVVASNGDLQIIPRVGNHQINFGDPESLGLKFRKLMTFYAQTLHQRDLNQYRTINLKYANQVVCEKF